MRGTQMRSYRNIAAVFLGGMFGGAIRQCLTALWPAHTVTPWNLFTVNLIGACVLAFVHRLTQKHLKAWAKLGLTTGLVGALTTFSSFAYDTMKEVTLAPVRTIIYVSASTAISIGMFYLVDMALLARSNRKAVEREQEAV